MYEPEKPKLTYNSLPADPHFFKSRRNSKKSSHNNFDAYMLVSLVKKKNDSFRLDFDDNNKSLTVASNNQLVVRKSLENDIISETLAKRT